MDPRLQLKEVTAQELVELNNSDSRPFIIDVREPWEIELSPFPLPFHHIPLGQLSSRLDELPMDGKIVVACHFGGRSAQACFILQSQGYENTYNLRGGIDGWAREIDAAITRY